MADEINTPNHRYYQLRNHIKLAESDMCKSLIFASGVRKIDSFMISPLFAAAEPGVWYDPSDLTTLFQDDLGATPVTTPGQTVGKMLDKSGQGNHATQATSTQRPTYGINPIVGTRNLLTYTEQFDNAAWSKTNTTVTANATTAPDGTSTADTIVALATLSQHRVDYVTTIAAGTYTFSCYVKAAGYNYVWLRMGLSPSAIVSLVDGSITNLAGGTAAATNVGNGWWRVALSGSCLANSTCRINASTDNAGTDFTGDGTSGIYAWGAQLEASATATAYQKVVSQYEVTEAGVQSVSYLAFDGVDDGMVTNTITPAIDKVQVFAGVRKLSDAATAMLAEFSSDVNSNSGSFYITAPNNTGGVFAWVSRGSILPANGASSSALTAPTTRIITGLADISAPLARIRINGVIGTDGTLSQGTGNYLAYPLYIGRRGGTTLPFNGRLYSLITRFGANLTTDQIASTESWVNAKTGAY